MPKSIVETLRDSVRGESSDVQKTIAKELLKFSWNKDFLSLSDLARVTFCSESAITKYCKKLGFSGYKEFVVLYKAEREKYTKNNYLFKVVESEQIFDYLDFVKTEISENQSFIKNFQNSISNNKKLIIFSSYQLIEQATFLKDYSATKNIEAKFCSNRHFEIHLVEKAREKEVTVLILLAGQDNAWLVNEIYEEIIKTNDQAFVISSSSQSEKVKTQFKFLLNSPEGYYGYEFRRVYLDVLSLVLFSKV